MTENEKTIKAFCARFEPPLTYCKTQRVNGVPIPDAWQTSMWLESQGLGITIIAHSGLIYSYIEATGKADIAPKVGDIFSGVFAKLKEQLPQAEAPDDTA